MKTQTKLKIQVLSDLHLEFMHKDETSDFITSLVKENVDVLVLAGDIITSQCLSLLEEFCFYWPEVIYVTGNHTYYHSSFHSVHVQLKKLSDKFKNFHWLHNSSVLIKGQKFVGTTLWFPETDYSTDLYLKRQLNDFRFINELNGCVFEENKNARHFLRKEVDENSIIITHHLPHPNSINEKYKFFETNCFYLCDMSNVIFSKNPKLWIHGHTHDSCDYTLDNGTRIVCNPYGYFQHQVNPQWQENFIVEI